MLIGYNWGKDKLRVDRKKESNSSMSTLLWNYIALVIACTTNGGIRIEACFNIFFVITNPNIVVLRRVVKYGPLTKAPRRLVFSM